MSDEHTIIGAFSEEHAARLAHASRFQLREWDRLGLIKPSYGAATGLPYGRIYSFRDLVSLRVLGQLRNGFRVSNSNLKAVFGELSKYSDSPWASLKLQVLGRRVVVIDPNTRKKREVLTGQLVLDLPLKVVISGLKHDIAKLNERGEAEIGKITKEKFVNQNTPVVAGTRVPVPVIKSFAAAGYSIKEIRREYPDLTDADINAAINHQEDAAA